MSGGAATYNRRGKRVRNRRELDGLLRYARQEVAMKLVPVKQAQAKFFNAPADKGLKSLTLATFKKDRSLILERDGEGWFLVEDGFEKSRSPLPPGAAGKRLLREAFKREFPRSANAYLAEVR